MTGSTALASQPFNLEPQVATPVISPSDLPLPLLKQDNQSIAIVVGDSRATLKEKEKARKDAEEKQRLQRQNTGSTRGGATLCSCVLFAEAKTGFNIGSIGYAKNWPINSQVPTVGAVVITRESSGDFYTGHVGVVEKVDDTTVYINDANYSRCRETHRALPRTSDLIRGYYTQ